MYERVQAFERVSRSFEVVEVDDGGGEIDFATREGADITGILQAIDQDTADSSVGASDTDG